MGGEKVRVSIIIPHYNKKECLERLFPTIVDQTFRDFEVIVIDDCTPDESTISFIQDYIQGKPYMRLERNTVSMRLAATCNKGIGLARGEYICFLNSDTELKSDFLRRHVEVLDSDPSIGALSCLVVDQYEKVRFSGGFSFRGVPSIMRDDIQNLRRVDFLESIAAFYRKEVFDQVGLFDESYFIYYEDADMGMRIKSKTGFRTCVFPERLTTFYVGPEMGRHGYYNVRSLMLFMRRYSRWYEYTFTLARFVVVVCVVANLVNGVRNAFAGFRGALDGLLGRTARSYR